MTLFVARISPFWSVMMGSFGGTVEARENVEILVVEHINIYGSGTSGRWRLSRSKKLLQVYEQLLHATWHEAHEFTAGKEFPA